MANNVFDFFCHICKVVFVVGVCFFSSSCSKDASQVVISNMSDKTITIKSMSINGITSIEKSVVVDPLNGRNISLSVFYGSANIKPYDILKFEYFSGGFTDFMSCEIKEEFCVYYFVYKGDGYYCYCDSLNDVGS